MKQHQPKPGSSSKDAQKIGGQTDFGVPESDVTERTYTSTNTRRSDPGSAQPRSGTLSRESGVGAPASGPGSASGGDLDMDFTGVGNGRALSQNGPDQNYHGGPDEAQPISGKQQRKPAPKQNLNVPGKGQSTVSRTPDNPGTLAEGADAITNPAARNDNSFAAEISRDEASGRNSR